MNDGFGNCEADVVVRCSKGKHKHTIAIEMKCYRRLASSGTPRGAQDIFHKDVFDDLSTLEKYVKNRQCDETVFLAMTDFENIVYPKKRIGKLWKYDISDDSTLTPGNYNTPVGGHPINIDIAGSDTFNWVKNGNFYFLEL